MPNYVINNDIIRIIPDAAINIETKLPLGTYTVEIINPMTGELGLKRTVDFEKPAKVYGEAERQSDRIISTFEQRPVNTGVMLGGEKGSGKTFLAKYISWKVLQRDTPPSWLTHSSIRLFCLSLSGRSLSRV